MVPPRGARLVDVAGVHAVAEELRVVAFGGADPLHLARRGTVTLYEMVFFIKPICLHSKMSTQFQQDLIQILQNTSSIREVSKMMR